MQKAGGLRQTRLPYAEEHCCYRCSVTGAIVPPINDRRQSSPIASAEAVGGNLRGAAKARSVTSRFTAGNGFAPRVKRNPVACGDGCCCASSNGPGCMTGAGQVRETEPGLNTFGPPLLRAGGRIPTARRPLIRSCHSHSGRQY